MRCSAPSVHSCLPSSHRQPPRFRCDDAKRRWMLAVASCPSDKPASFRFAHRLRLHPPFPSPVARGLGAASGFASGGRCNQPVPTPYWPGGGCLSHGGASVSLPWWQGFGERQTLACVVPHSPGPRRSLTRRRTGDRGPGGDGCFAIRQHPRQTAAPERPHDPWPGLIRPLCDVVEWWVGGGCRDPVQINNWISETGLPDYEIPWFF